MPLQVKDFSWNQTGQQVTISLPLKGIDKSKVDILSTEEYIKVNFPPYFFEAFLYENIDNERSKAELRKSELLFILPKQSNNTWPMLEKELDKSQKMEHRQKAIELVQERTKQLEKQREEEKAKRQKYAVNQQIKLEQENREKLESRIEHEKQVATTELEQWKERQQKAEPQLPSAAGGSSNKNNDRVATRPAFKAKPILTLDDQLAAEQQPIRARGKITVTFTPRSFPTPERESQSAAEQEWLEKQAHARRLATLEDTDLTEAEKDPVVLQRKGDDFYRSADYQSAVNAYGLAIRLQPRLHSNYTNRATCFMRLGNFVKAIEDLTRVMELLTPPVPDNQAARVRVHVKRAAALSALKLYPEALADLVAAIRLDDSNEQLKKDAERLRRLIQSS